MPDQNAQITWREGQVPVSTQFDDPYFSLEDGAAETAYVFLAGNDLPERFRPGFHIAELGFGTGLNLLLAWDAWMRAGLDRCNSPVSKPIQCGLRIWRRPMRPFPRLTGGVMR